MVQEKVKEGRQSNYGKARQGKGKARIGQGTDLVAREGTEA